MDKVSCFFSVYNNLKFYFLGQQIIKFLLLSFFLHGFHILIYLQLNLLFKSLFTSYCIERIICFIHIPFLANLFHLKILTKILFYLLIEKVYIIFNKNLILSSASVLKLYIYNIKNQKLTKFLLLFNLII